MTTRRFSYFFGASLLSLAFLSVANCGGDNGSGTSLAGGSTSGASSSGSSSGEGGSGGNSCVMDSDCKQPNSICEQNVCITSTCVNGIKDTGESDVDCGGAGCLPCANGKLCTDAEDCASKSCNGSGGMGGAGGGGTLTCAACIDEADCAGAPGTYCAAGTCTPKKMGAAVCAGDAECQSGFCPPQDGVCCDSRCDHTCEACTASRTGGADGTCAAVTADSDPDLECLDKGAATCGANGTGCNGNKSTPACKVYDNKTVCAPASCMAAQATLDSTCDGNGTCVAPAATPCSPYLCDASAIGCLTSCTTNAQCETTHFCDTATSTCVVKKNNGGTCNSGAQCASGFCPTQDGVCCDTACNTTCRACVVNKTGSASGTCGNITNNTDPDNECTQILAPNCNGAGQCG